MGAGDQQTADLSEKLHFRHAMLFSKTQGLNNRPVTPDVLAFQVVEQPAPLADYF